MKTENFCFWVILILSISSLFSYTLFEERDWIFRGDVLWVEGELALGSAIEIPPLRIVPVFTVRWLDYQMPVEASQQTQSVLGAMELTPYALLIFEELNLRIQLIQDRVPEQAGTVLSIDYTKLLELSERLKSEYLAQKQGTLFYDTIGFDDYFIINLFLRNLETQAKPKPTIKPQY